MEESGWRVLAAFVQENGPDEDQALGSHLGAAVSELHLPEVFLERLKAALAQTVRKASQRHDGHAAHPAVELVVMASRAAPDAENSQLGWGFFLIEKNAAPPDRHSIELFLYRDARSEP